MAATEGLAFISETLGRLTSLEEQIGRIGGIGSQIMGMKAALSETNQWKPDLDTLIDTTHQPYLHFKKTKTESLFLNGRYWKANRYRT